MLNINLNITYYLYHVYILKVLVLLLRFLLKIWPVVVIIFKVDILVKIVKFTSPESLPSMKIEIKALLELTLVVNIITVLSCNRISGEPNEEIFKKLFTYIEYRYGISGSRDCDRKC